MNVTIDGLDDLEAALDALENLDRGEITYRASEEMLSRVSEGVPVDSGDLKRSGRTERSGDTARLLWDDVPYAGIVEQRQRWFQPVVESEGPDILREEMEEALAEALRDA